MLVAIFIAFVFISSINGTVGTVIGYPAIRRGGAIRICDGNDPALCQLPKPTSPYRRGCEVGTRCKRPPIRFNNA